MMLRIAGRARGPAIAFRVRDVAASALGSLSRLRGRVGVGGASTSGLARIAENTPVRREPSPAALCERGGLSRKRERRRKRLLHGLLRMSEE